MNASAMAEDSLFSLLDQTERKALSEHLKPRRFAKDEFVFRTGDEARCMYLVRSGKVQVVLDTYEGERVVVAELDSGEVLGEISFFDGGPRTASAQATEESELLECTHEALVDFLAGYPHAALDLLRVMGKRLRKTDDLLRLRATRNANLEEAEKLTFGERIADKVATFGGSWTFIFTFGAILVTWVIINSVLILRHPFDPFPYILLNLFLSMIAALQAPVIMMSQNRQSTKDRLKADLDYEVNLKAELEIAELHKRVDAIFELLNSREPRRSSSVKP